MWNVVLSVLLNLTPSAAPASGARLELPAVIDRVQKRYEAAADFRARFSQESTTVAFGRKKTLSGELLIKKPGRMRWNYETPDKSMYLSDGHVFWKYEVEDKQAYKQDLKGAQLPAAVSFLMGKGKLTDEFEVTFAKEIPYGGPQDYRLSLKPKKPQSTYRSIHFVVDPVTFFVRQSVLINVQGDIHAFTFTDVKVNTKIPDATFKWSPPPDAHVTDLSKTGK